MIELRIADGGIPTVGYGGLKTIVDGEKGVRR
jgi:hypothetical protein